MGQIEGKEQVENIEPEHDHRNENGSLRSDNDDNTVSMSIKHTGKLCNRYILKGKCVFGEECRYDHLPLCKSLKEDGICNDNNCKDGHNIGGICRKYISTGCRNDWCRFLHIKIKTIPKNHESIDLRKSPDVGLDDTPTFAEEPGRRDASEEYKVLDELYDFDEMEDRKNEPETDRFINNCAKLTDL